MEKWMILGLGQEKYEMKLEYLVVTESVFKNSKRIRLCQMNIRPNLKAFPMAKARQIRATN